MPFQLVYTDLMGPVDGRQSPTNDGGGQRPAAGGGSGEQGGPAGGITSDSGGAPPPSQVTPAVTRQQQGCFSAIINSRPAQTIATLSLHQHGNAGYGSPYGMLTYAEYSYAATNVQIQRLEGAKVLIIPNTFKEAMALPEAARWKAVSDKDMESLRAHKVYDLLPTTSIPIGQKAISSRWVYKIKADKSFRGHVVVHRWGHVSGRDCGGTFAPFCRIQSIRMVLATAAEVGWTIWQLDVQTAFLLRGRRGGGVG